MIVFDGLSLDLSVGMMKDIYVVNCAVVSKIRRRKGTVAEGKK
jgi:hypothetical protein